MNNKKSVPYTAPQTQAILQVFSNISSYEEQILQAEKLASSALFSTWNNSHSAKQILAKVSNMSRPAKQPVLSYIKRSKPEPKPKKLQKIQLVAIIAKILGYDMFSTAYNYNKMAYVKAYTLVDIIKMLIYEKDLSTVEVLGDYSEFNLSEFFTN